MKNLKALKKLTVSLLSLAILFSGVAPVAAATDDDKTSKTSETTTKDNNDTATETTTNDNETTDDDDSKTTKNTEDDSENEENAEAKNAVDVDFSSLKIGDQFKDSEGITYTVDDLTSNIYVGSGENQKLYPSGSSEIPNFEITYTTKDGYETWRKYVKLEDLCQITKNDGSHICEIMKDTDMKNGEFYLKRMYKQKIYSSNVKTVHSNDLDMDVGIPDAQEISLYYKSYHKVDTKRFEAILQLVYENGSTDPEVYTFENNKNIQTEGTWSTETNDEGNEVSILSTDIETLKDNNGVVYVSLRFVSESLGAEVTWYSKEDSKTKDDDDVVIQFYDDKEYCKDIEYTFTGNGHEISPKEFEKSLYITKESEVENLSLNGTYKYTDNDNETVTSNVDWKKVYILLTIPDSYPDGFIENAKSLQNSILWVDDSGENYLWAKRALYGKYSSENGTCSIDGTEYNCDLGEEINITGIIMYKGVPIPIDLFNINSESCSSSKND